MKVGILTSPFYKAYMVNYPLKAFSKHLRDENISCDFLYFESKNLFSYDVLVITADAFRNKLRKFTKLPDRRILLSKLADKGKIIIWYDTSDSTGISVFNVFPYVNLYMKNSILKDKTIYSNQGHNKRIFSDYYHNHFGVENQSEIIWPRLQPKYQKKLSSAWSIGLNNFSRNVKSKFHNFHQFLHYSYSNISPIPAIVTKDIGVSYHVSYPTDLPAIHYQRKKIYKLLNQIKDEKGIVLSIDKKLTPKEYKKVISATAVLPSPFGWGEICARDYEAFVYGTALFKPDMSMIETWPDYYIPNETYVPFSWDFTDFKTKLIELLDDSERRISIATQGQKNYMKSISPEGGRSFAKRFKSLLTLALDTKR